MSLDHVSVPLRVVFPEFSEQLLALWRLRLHARIDAAANVAMDQYRSYSHLMSRLPAGHHARAVVKDAYETHGINELRNIINGSARVI